MIPYKKDSFADNEATLEAGEGSNSTAMGDNLNNSSMEATAKQQLKKKSYASLPMSPKLRLALQILQVIGLIVLFVVFVALCFIVIINGLKNIAFYSSDATMTRTTLYRNKSIQLPPPTVCVQLDSSEFGYGDYENLDTLEDRLKEALDRKIFAKLFGGYADELARGGPPDPEVAIHMPLVFLTARMLIDISRAEQPFFTNSSRRWTRISELFDLDSFLSGDEKQSRQRSAVVLKFFNEKMKMSDDYSYEQTNIIKSVGALLCSAMEMKVKSNHVKPRLLQDIFREIHPCYKENVTWLGLIPMSFKQEELLCVKIKGGRNFRFSSAKDMTIIGFNPQKLYNDSDASLATEAYVDFTGQRVTNNIKSDILAVPFQKLTTASVTIDTDYESMNTNKTPCHPLATSSACKRSCKAKMVATKCGCWPLSMFYGYEGNGIGYCSEKRADGQLSDEPFTLRGAASSFLPRTNKSCTTDTQKAFNSTICEHQCPEKCSHMVLSFNTHQASLDDDADNETTVIFQVDRFSYLQTKEVLIVDLWDLATEAAMDVGILILFIMVICWVCKSLWARRFLCLPGRKADDLQVIFRKETGGEIEIHPKSGLVNPTTIVDALKSLEGQEYLKSFFKTFVVESNENKYETIPPRR